LYKGMGEKMNANFQHLSEFYNKITSSHYILTLKPTLRKNLMKPASNNLHNKDMIKHAGSIRPMC
jgi:hypothetical protein